MLATKLGNPTLRQCGLFFVLLSAAAAVPAASAQTLTPLVSFNGSSAATPYAGLIADGKGDLFGTTAGGGASGNGTVFEIAKKSSGYARTPTILVSFNYGDGAVPNGGLLADRSGNLFGTTGGGGASQNGTVFEIAKTSSGYAHTPTTLVSFNEPIGEYPYAGLLADRNGNLFGTTSGGGPNGDGTAFEIAKTASGYARTPTILVSFDWHNGSTPSAGLIADGSGNLFGTTFSGGAFKDGTVFEIAKTATGYAHTPVTLVSFNMSDGGYPYAGLIADGSGNLFGTTQEGGASGYGTVFEIAKTSTGYARTPITLVTFSGRDGAYPYASLIVDGSGNLFGTTQGGGANADGTVFKIAKTTSGYAGRPTALVSFNGRDGAYPYAGLIANGSGDLFGTTQGGGASGNGTVFEITGSGFVPVRTFAGTPGSANCIGASISALAQAYGGIAHAASALGYNSVSALQSAVASYCSD